MKLTRLLTPVCSVLFIFCANIAQGDLSWIYTADLTQWDASCSGDMFVQMYQDVDSNTSLGDISSFTSEGAPIGGNSNNDVLLSSFTALTLDGKAGVSWGVSFPSWGSLYSEDVYTVLFNASTIGASAHAVVVDSSVHTLAASDPADYKLSSVANNWVAVPEPTTIAFLGLGMLLFFVRKKKRA